MKKFLFLLSAVAFALLFMAAGCADSGTAESGGNGGSPSADETEQLPSDDETDGEKAYEEFYITKKSDGNGIYCRLYLPENGGSSLPAVILSHSAAMTADSMNLYAIGFAERGYAAVAFDFCGGSANSRSDGAQEDMTLFTEKEDLETVLDAVKEFEFVDENRIYLFGTSQGGLVSALVANDTQNLAGLILLYPAFNIAELAQSYSSTGSAGFTGFDWSELLGLFGSIDWSMIDFGNMGFSFPKNGDEYISSLQDFDVYENIGGYKGRTLILHGSKDLIVDSSYSERAAQVYENCELYIIEGAFHGFNRENYGILGDYDDVVWEHIDQFLDI